MEIEYLKDQLHSYQVVLAMSVLLNVAFAAVLGWWIGSRNDRQALNLALTPAAPTFGKTTSPGARIKFHDEKPDELP